MPPMLHAGALCQVRARLLFLRAFPCYHPLLASIAWACCLLVTELCLDAPMTLTVQLSLPSTFLSGALHSAPSLHAPETAAWLQMR